MERYDIYPNHNGTWSVIDTENGNGARSTHNTREEALAEAIRLDNP